MKETFERSEIINQKKKFIFDVEQSDDYVFPNEEFTYYIYIKNISGAQITNFRIYIEHPDLVTFYPDSLDTKPVKDLDIDEIELYTLTAVCEDVGEYNVHFVAYGEESEIMHKMLTIKCSRVGNSANLIHKIHILNFNPYEDTYIMEASNYSESVTQILKKQKLPYKARQNPFKFKKIKRNPENVESLSYWDQLQEILLAEKNKEQKEHVYQYLSREVFEENALEIFEGKNLRDLINNINENSQYFKADLIRTGTNKLLNDLYQFKPNGFFYRMGLLNSEIYHHLGVIPEYTYMSDRIFRWAPTDKDSDLKIIPERKPMRWNQHIWSGGGWFVYKDVTQEYMNTEEYEKEFNDGNIEKHEFMGTFDSLNSAEEYVSKALERDNNIRAKRRETLIKYEYNIVESYYEPGVFFVHIPIHRIPSNFYIPSNEEIYNIINRTKPIGTKPLIKYLVKAVFDNNIAMSRKLNYGKKFDFDVELERESMTVTEKKKVFDTKTINNVSYKTSKDITSRIAMLPKPIENEIVNSTSLVNHFGLIAEDDFDNTIKLDLDNNIYGHEMTLDTSLDSLKDFLQVLYERNYNNIAFKMEVPPLEKVDSIQEVNDIVKEDGNIVFGDKEVDTFKIPIINRTVFNETPFDISVNITDIFDNVYEFSVTRNLDEHMDQFTYSILSKNKRKIEKVGLQNIESLFIKLIPFKEKQMVLFFIEDKERFIHYFDHVILSDVKTISFSPNVYNYVYIGSYSNAPIIFETPYHYTLKTYQPDEIFKGSNWQNLFRIDKRETSYTYIANNTKEMITPDDIILFYDSMEIPETAIVKDVKFDIRGNSNKQGVYVDYGLSTGYITPESSNNTINLRPETIEVYKKDSHNKEYYESKLQKAASSGQETLVKRFTKLIEENEIFNDDENITVNSYMTKPNDFITISKPFWYEISNFSQEYYDLNNTESIQFIIEGYNHADEVDIIVQTLSQLDVSNAVKVNIPSGYFRKKINLLYQNKFSSNLLKVRFRFDKIFHDINIFDTSIDITFKDKENKETDWIFSQERNLENVTFDVINELDRPNDINNGMSLKLSFDDINPGDVSYINSTELKIVYKETEMKMLINKDKYTYQPFGINQSSIFGKVHDSYMSGSFYNDKNTMNQIQSNIGKDNRGIKLVDTIYQSFIARDDNITSIELYPNGVVGNPNDTLKISLYTNKGNTPSKLIKEVRGSGWTKTNTNIRNLPSIKYNINVDNLTKGKTYWFKVEVLNPIAKNYYLLKSVNKTIEGFKLLAKENNNYINTFSCLEFNIYSRNLSKTFKDLPIAQEIFDNPYILIGLHKSKGTISNLCINKAVRTITEDDHMVETFEENAPEVNFVKIKVKYSSNGGQTIEKIEEISSDGTKTELETGE